MEIEEVIFALRVEPYPVTTTSLSTEAADSCIVAFKTPDSGTAKIIELYPNEVISTFVTDNGILSIYAPSASVTVALFAPTAFTVAPTTG